MFSVCDGEVRAIYRSQNIVWIRLIDGRRKQAILQFQHESRAFVRCLGWSATVAEDGEVQLPHHDSSETKRAASARPAQQITDGYRDIRIMFV